MRQRRALGKHCQLILEEGFKKQSVANTGDTMPLNVLVRRYSTKNYKQHHVEEMKVEFFDEEIQ